MDRCENYFVCRNGDGQKLIRKMQGSFVAEYHGSSIAAISLYPKFVLVSHIVARGDLEKDRAGLERVEMCVGTVHLHTISGQGGLYSHRLCLP